MPVWIQTLLRLAAALLDWIWKERARARAAAVRADPGSEWLRRFGGSDRRNNQAATGPEDSGGGGDG